MLLATLLGLGIVWRLIELFVITQLSCGETLRFWQGEAPLGPTLLGVFAVAFTAMFCLWVIDLTRVRHRRPAIWATTVQAFLFVAILTVLTTWSSFINTYSVFKPISDTLRYSFHVIRIANVSEVLLFEANPGYEYWSTKRIWERELGPLVMGRHSFKDCSCMSLSQQRTREELMWLAYDVQQGALTHEEANQIRRDTPKPIEPEWCEATLDLARTVY
ncbi:conserved membrane hypothetical protein [Oceanicaulis sp. 350]|uniref:hypothetical protein n=1 Tax=Oceanicaulis sp. TaxID=1924941 RepID=UPI0012F35E6F|nr:conserved membrane hypothetical protein [Oceanicaulis sp. 350]